MNSSYRLLPSMNVTLYAYKYRGRWIGRLIDVTTEQSCFCTSDKNMLLYYRRNGNCSFFSVSLPLFLSVNQVNQLRPLLRSNSFPLTRSVGHPLWRVIPKSLSRARSARFLGVSNPIEEQKRTAGPGEPPVDCIIRSLYRVRV